MIGLCAAAVRPPQQLSVQTLRSAAPGQAGFAAAASRTHASASPHNRAKVLESQASLAAACLRWNQ